MLCTFVETNLIIHLLTAGLNFSQAGSQMANVNSTERQHTVFNRNTCFFIKPNDFENHKWTYEFHKTFTVA